MKFLTVITRKRADSSDYTTSWWDEPGHRWVDEFEKATKHRGWSPSLIAYLQSQHSPDLVVEEFAARMNPDQILW